MTTDHDAVTPKIEFSRVPLTSILLVSPPSCVKNCANISVLRHDPKELCAIADFHKIIPGLALRYRKTIWRVSESIDNSRFVFPSTLFKMLDSSMTTLQHFRLSNASSISKLMTAILRHAPAPWFCNTELHQFRFDLLPVQFVEQRKRRR